MSQDVASREDDTVLVRLFLEGADKEGFEARES